MKEQTYEDLKWTAKDHQKLRLHNEQNERYIIFKAICELQELPIDALEFMRTDNKVIAEHSGIFNHRFFMAQQKILLAKLKQLKLQEQLEVDNPIHPISKKKPTIKGYRHCWNCNSYKIYDEFYKGQTRCIDCDKLYHAERKLKTKEKEETNEETT